MSNMLKIDNLPDEQEEIVQHACVVFRAELLICINEQILYNRIFFFLPFSPEEFRKPLGNVYESPNKVTIFFK